MPMEQIRRNQALTKAQFHQRLRHWFQSTNDAIVGREEVRGQTAWVYVRDGTDMFVLNADTSRDAVDRYLQIVTAYGDDLQWEAAQSQRGNMTAVTYGPHHVRLPPFYLYLA